MKRSELKEIIRECAIEADCRSDAIQTLVATGDSASRVAFGSWFNFKYNCGCPATLAGYYDPDTGKMRLDIVGIANFTDNFDSEMRRIISTDKFGQGYVNVED